ncbi:MAG TPA: acetyl-CoA carboxylase biotin carboxyl carrier protein [Terriglobia bacterium]|nr:acetyl-CoA carboxylase biotin carboxyl carrier protein [Terriglobia bacterium]
MTLKELKELIDLFTSRESIEELEIEKSGVRLKVRRQSRQLVHEVSSFPVLTRPAPNPAPEAPPAAAVVIPSEDLFLVKAPIVGTFYKAANPSSPPFVNVGDFVEKGTVLCIVEAMKLMNEIESEVAGQVTAAFVENGQPVEFGEKLFAIKRS